MKKNYVSIYLLMIIFISVFFVSNVQANATIGFSGVKSENSVDCFDYYKFQSVQVSAGASQGEYIPGENIVFKGRVINQNDYPIVDGYIFARIGKINPNYRTEGQFTVDEFFVKEQVILSPKEEQLLEFSWKVPSNVTNGEYQIDFFFSAGKKFNLGGLPFTNEIVGGMSRFKINSVNNTYLSFDKSGTKVNGETYKHIGNWPEVKKGEKAEIVQSIKNTFGEEKKMRVSYDLYWWDALLEKDKLETKTEDVVVPANGSKDLSYTIPAVNDSVYFLKITATDGTQKTITNIRVVSRQEHLRLNFPAINKFPLAKGETAALFSCFHNAAPSSTNGKVSLLLTDKKGKEVGKMEYQGEISGAMMAAKSDITVGEDYDWLKLTATVTDKDGKVVDNYETIYDCATLGSAQCQALAQTEMQENKIVEKGKKCSQELWGVGCIGTSNCKFNNYSYEKKNIEKKQ